VRRGVFLRFSLLRGRSDGTLPVPLRRSRRSLAATLRADPAKAAMLGTANGAGIHESVHPCTTLKCLKGGPQLSLLLWLLRQDAAQTGPPEARRGCVGNVRRRPRTMRGRSLYVHGRTFSEPRSTLAHLEGRSPEGAPPGGCFFGYLSLHKQRKEPARRRASGSSAPR